MPYGIANWLIAMAQIGSIRNEATDGDTDGDVSEISYITDEVKGALQSCLH